ncbi:MAG: alpha/beta hydrolase [Planctomycetota bacterium]|nr:alpha/beta hydrolase [Planctomycetota bacterium]
MSARRTRNSLRYLLAVAAVAGTGLLIAAAPSAPEEARQSVAPAQVLPPPVHYRSVTIDGLDIAYREAGPADAPTILLLHGFPTSSHMFRNLIPMLADKYRVIAPDYPGYGNSSMPSVDEFDYSFDNLAQVVDKFTGAVGARSFVMYVQDYGAPIGYRIAAAHPERIRGLIVQNGNAYDEGLKEFWDPFKAHWKAQTPQSTAALAKFLEIDATRWQYTHGVGDESRISPDTWKMDQLGLDRPGNKDIQLRLFLSYGTNPPLYPKWQEYFRTHQPPTLIVWGKNDYIFPADGAEPYKRDLKNIDFNLLDTGHFALEEKGPEIAAKIRDFMASRVK